MKKIIMSLVVAAAFLLGGCQEKQTTNRIYVFSQPGCIHCEHAKNYFERYYKNYDIKDMNIHEGNNMDYLMRYARKYHISKQSLGTPLIVMGENYVMGWGEQQQKDFNRYIRNFTPKADTKK